MKHTLITCSLAIAVALFSSTGICGPKDKKAAFPPRVVKTEPANLAEGVEYTLKEIKVTFDRKMKGDQSWSWILQQNIGVYPGYRSSGPPKWENGGKTCVLPVKLSPDTLYAVGVNSYRHTGFKDTNGKIAIPYTWVFKTKKAK
jgi:hypothetical protein